MQSYFTSTLYSEHPVTVLSAHLIHLLEYFFSLSSIARVFDRGHVQTAEVLLRGCPKLPLPHYPGVTDMFW